MKVTPYELMRIFFFYYSCISNTDSMSRWHHSKVRNLGHCRTGTIPQFGPYVLQRSTSCYCSIWHHKSSNLP